MFSIDMGGCDIVLGAEWLRTLVMVTMDFKELYMSFVKDSHTHTLYGINDIPPDLISSQHMENLLKEGHYGIISQFYVTQGFETTPLKTLSEMKQVLDTYILVFELPIGLPPIQGEHDHNIPLLPSSYPPNVFPYRSNPPKHQPLFLTSSHGLKERRRLEDVP